VHESFTEPLSSLSETKALEDANNKVSITAGPSCQDVDEYTPGGVCETMLGTIVNTASQATAEEIWYDGKLSKIRHDMTRVFWDEQWQQGKLQTRRQERSKHADTRRIEQKGKRLPSASNEYRWGMGRNPVASARQQS
jgi:hypothetical protein